MLISSEVYTQHSFGLISRLKTGQCDWSVDWSMWLDSGLVNVIGLWTGQCDWSVDWSVDWSMWLVSGLISSLKTGQCDWSVDWSVWLVSVIGQWTGQCDWSVDWSMWLVSVIASVVLYIAHVCKAWSWPERWRDFFPAIFLCFCGVLFYRFLLQFPQSV